eukprot:3257360-Prorocentrum_lima.AAC.1
MTSSLVGSEMCIRDSVTIDKVGGDGLRADKVLLGTIVQAHHGAPGRDLRHRDGVPLCCFCPHR